MAACKSQLQYKLVVNFVFLLIINVIFNES
jgi:hypothetical protein